MAKFFGLNWTNAVAVPSNIPVPSGDGGGSERAFYDEFTAPTGGLAINDTIDMCQPSGSLKSGDRVVAAEIVCDALGAGALLQLGDDGAANRFITAADSSAVARITMNNLANYGWQVDQDRPIRLTLTGAVMAAGKKVKMKIVVLRS